MEQTLTPRQREIKALLEREMSASEIGEELDITRNAVYQQIQAMRKKGALDPGYTPSGAPAREAGVVTHRLGAGENGEPLSIALIHEAADIADDLEQVVVRLRNLGS